MTPSPRFDNLLAALIANLTNAALLVEAGLLLLALVAWSGLALLRRRLAPHAPDWHRLAWPAALLVLVLVSRAAFALWQEPHLLNFAVPLLVSLLVIQGCFFLLRRILEPSRALHVLEHLVSWLVLGVLALHVTGHLAGVVAALDAIGLDIGRQHVSLYTVLMALLALGVALLAALWLSHLAERRVIAAMPLNANMRLAITKLARVLFVLVAVLIALPLVGIDITVLSVFGGALGVGLGLGLQKIAANYVSGFTLLLDQSIRIGDMIAVGEHEGEIRKIATRYTVVRGLNGEECIIPNETMITSTVVNKSLGEKANLVELPIQVAYGTDLYRVRELLPGLARDHARVLAAPEPQLRLKAFGDNGIDLALAVWIADPEEGELGLRSDLNWAIWEGFRREGIEIPYPRRVVHLVPAPGPAIDGGSMRDCRHTGAATPSAP